MGEYGIVSALFDGFTCFMQNYIYLVLKVNQYLRYWHDFSDKELITEIIITVIVASNGITGKA